MLFIFLIFLAAISIEGIGTFVSVLGLADTFSGDPIILTMAVCLDFAKLVVVSLLYKHWDRLGKMLRYFLLPMTIVMMVITSYGVAGYMSNSFQKALAPNTEVQVKLDAYQRERAKLETRKLEMDKQIAQLPENYVKARQKLMMSFAPELAPMNMRILELDKQILDLQVNTVAGESHLGPVAFLAKTFDMTPMTAASVIIMLIVFVFDPLAVLLVISGNMLLDDRAKMKANRPQAPPVVLDLTQAEHGSRFENLQMHAAVETELPEHVAAPDALEEFILEESVESQEEPKADDLLHADELHDENRLIEEPPVVYPDLDEPADLIESPEELQEASRDIPEIDDTDSVDYVDASDNMSVDEMFIQLEANDAGAKAAAEAGARWVAETFYDAPIEHVTQASSLDGIPVSNDISLLTEDELLTAASKSINTYRK